MSSAPVEPTPIALRVVFAVWSLGWAVGTVAFFHFANLHQQTSEERTKSLTGLVDSGDLRVEATIPDGGAEVTFVGALMQWEDTKTRKYVTSHVGWKRLDVPATITLVSGGEPLEMDVASWKFPVSRNHDAEERSKEPSEGFPLTPEEQAAAIAKANEGGAFVGWYAEHFRLPGGTQVYLEGRAERTGAGRRIVPSPGSDHVELFFGSHSEAVAFERSEATGLRIGGTIFGLLAALPWGLLLLRRAILRRRVEKEVEIPGHKGADS